MTSGPGGAVVRLRHIAGCDDRDGRPSTRSLALRYSSGGRTRQDRDDGLTIGSGGSGGVFGPSMVIGGCGGGALGHVPALAWPGWRRIPANFVIVGMAGFFAAAAKTPFSTLVIVSEMTGNYNLLLPDAVGLRAGVSPLGRAIDLQLPGGKPLAFAGAPGRLCSRSAGRAPRQPVRAAAGADSLPASGRPRRRGFGLRRPRLAIR